MPSEVNKIDETVNVSPFEGNHDGPGENTTV